MPETMLILAPEAAIREPGGRRLFDLRDPLGRWPDDEPGRAAAMRARGWSNGHTLYCCHRLDLDFAQVVEVLP